MTCLAVTRRLLMRQLYLLTFIGLADASGATEHCTPPTEYEPELCPLHHLAITSVKIEHNGRKAVAAQNDPVDCSAFRLDEAKVRRFFSKGKVVAPKNEHSLDWAPCSSDGVLRLANGNVVRWEIDQSKVGWLIYGTGNTTIVYCPDCDFEPFPKD